MLDLIKEILEKENFDCALIQATEETHYEHLLVFLGLDTKEREQILEITAQKQVFDVMPESEPDKDLYFRVQFQYTFPFKAQDMALSQVASFLLFLNQQVDFPGLELNELHNLITYRYVWLVKDKGLDAKLVISIIGIIMLLLELFSSSIERLASGEATFNELLEEVVHLAQSTSLSKVDPKNKF